MSTKLM